MRGEGRVPNARSRFGTAAAGTPEGEKRRHHQASMLATGLRRVAATRQPQALARTQRRFGGSLHKNPHVETWNNWRGDSERRFKFDAAFFKATLAWGVAPFTLYYVMASGERRARDRRNGVPENFRQ